MEEYDELENVPEVINGLEMVNEGFDKLNHFLNLGNQALTNLTPILGVLTDMHQNVRSMDNQLDAYIIKCEDNLQRFNKAADIIEKQLDGFSNRMDKLTERILADDFSKLDEQNMRNREMLIDLLTSQNETFNNMIMKLLMR